MFLSHHLTRSCVGDILLTPLAPRGGELPAVGVGLVLLIAATAKDASSQEAIDDRLPG